MRSCSVVGCLNTYYARGVCDKHYKKLLRYGNPLLGKSKRANGSGSLRSDGYIDVTRDGKRIKRHIQVAEEILGRALPPGAVVHHVNEIPSDNRPENLVICPNRAYHNLIHQRMRAMAACGHADWMKCQYCKKYDPVERLHSANRENGNVCHLACGNAARRKYYSPSTKLKGA